MDQLEKFIRENKEAFDLKTPPPHLWQNIAAQLPEQAGDKNASLHPLPKNEWRQSLRLAAAVALLLTAGAAIGAFLTHSASRSKTLSDISPEYAETEKYYDQQIRLNLSKLASIRQDQLVSEDIRTLDSMYQQLALELHQAPPATAAFIVEAMINNYKTRIEILEQVLLKIEQAKSLQSKYDKNEVNL